MLKARTKYVFVFDGFLQYDTYLLYNKIVIVL